MNIDSAVNYPSDMYGNALIIENCCDTGSNDHLYQIIFGSTYGSASILCAETGFKICSCKTSVSLTRPIPEKPSEGRVNIFVEANEIDGTELSYVKEIVDKVFRNHVIDVESLCVLNGELVWNLRVDLNFYGSKASLTALSVLLISCLLDFRRPALLTNDKGLIEQVSQDIEAPIPLTLFQIPLLFSLRKDSYKEHNIQGLRLENTSNVMTHIAMNKNKEIVFALNLTTSDTELEPLTNALTYVSQVCDNMINKICENKRSTSMPTNFFISCGNTTAKSF